MRPLTFALAAALLAGAATYAYAEPYDGGWHHGDGAVGMELFHAANLTDAQKDQARQIMHSDFSAMRGTMDQMHALHEQMQSGLLSGATQAQLAGILTKEEALRSQMDEQRLAAEVQLRNLLTPSQLSAVTAARAKLASLHDQERAIESGNSAQ